MRQMFDSWPEIKGRRWKPTLHEGRRSVPAFNHGYRCLECLELRCQVSSKNKKGQAANSLIDALLDPKGPKGTTASLQLS